MRWLSKLAALHSESPDVMYSSVGILDWGLLPPPLLVPGSERVLGMYMRSAAAVVLRVVMVTQSEPALW